MEQKIGEGRDIQQLAFVPRACVRVSDHSAHDGGETLELLNPKVPGLFHEQWIVGNQRPLRLSWAVAGWKCVANCGRILEQILEQRNRFWNKLRETEHN